jgi:hypothetical protein
MTEKKKVENFKGLLDDLQGPGLTYEEMMNKYDMTRWGARKLGDNAMIKSEKAGNHEKIFSLKDETGNEKEEIAAVELPVQSSEDNHEEVKRNDNASKQTITNKATTYLKELENEVKNSDTPVTDYTEPDYNNTKGFTAIIHETDSHFSAHVKNQAGNTVYDTERAKQATREAFIWYSEKIIERNWKNLDEIVLLLGGDLLEGEGIYEHQAHKIDDTLETQIEAARNTYFKMIQNMKTSFKVPVKVVCVSGNHGDLKIPGSSSGANADDIIYSMLEDMVDLSGLKNVKFVRSDRSDYTTFNYRGWKGYLTHGENRKEHIGTASGKRDWLAIKDKYGFDAAWRGHYHMQKRETVNGVPVFMTNSRKPGDDYTDTIAAFGETGNAIYFATDDERVDEVKTESDVL